MKKEYKEYFVKTLYGFMEGSTDCLAESMMGEMGFQRRFGFKPDYVNIDMEDTRILDRLTGRVLQEGESYQDGYQVCKMIARVSVQGEKYTFVRDSYKEFELHLKHLQTCDKCKSNDWCWCDYTATDECEELALKEIEDGARRKFVAVMVFDNCKNCPKFEVIKFDGPKICEYANKETGDIPYHCPNMQYLMWGVDPNSMNDIVKFDKERAVIE